MDGWGEDLATDSCYLELLIVVFSLLTLRASEQAHLKEKKQNCLFVTHVNGTIGLKGSQPQIIHCNPPFEDLNASNWAFMTYKLHPTLCLFKNFPFSLWHLFFFLPATLRSDIEPLPVGVLSCLTPVHIFAVPSPPPSRQ